MRQRQASLDAPTAKLWNERSSLLGSSEAGFNSDRRRGYRPEIVLIDSAYANNASFSEKTSRKKPKVYRRYC